MMQVRVEAQKDEAAARLIAAGRAMLARGDSKFPLTRLCAEAGVSLEDFRRTFATKAALLQQLMEAQQPEPAAPDAWLERRLRVFERALSVLEERAEKREREHGLTIARLEEKLTAMNMGSLVPDRRLVRREQPVPETPVATVDTPAMPQPDSAPQAPNSVPEELQLAPLEPEPIPVITTDYLEAARQAAMAHGRALDSKPRPRRPSLRWLTIAVLTAFVLFVCAALTLIHAEPPARPGGESAARKIAVPTALARLTAAADSGDARAQASLALVYLRGDGVAKDDAAAARWADAAARRGDAEAQYLAGSLSRNDPARAFAWFRRGAAMGSLKAMHNLAIAYLTGAGAPKDETAAAQWFTRAAAGGYIDAAFDLGVLYERGQGVKQDAHAALRWYDAAAVQGDGEAAARARILRAQTHI